MVTVEEAERKLRRRGAMRSHLVAVFLTACVSLSAMEVGADAPRPDPPEAPPVAAATPPQAAAAAVEHAAPAGSPADAAANAPAENMGAECMQAAILMVNRSPRHPRSAEPTAAASAEAGGPVSRQEAGGPVSTICERCVSDV